MAIDHGTKKIGIAFCDEMEIIASPYDAWPLEKGATLAKLAKLAESENAEAILVGLPLHKDGNESATAAGAREFGHALAGLANLPLEFINEHLTSAEAKRLLAQCGTKQKRRSGAKEGRAKLDAAAAAVLLQEHIENRRSSGN
jgi:putative Holliday junction resolvase